ncbi:hypothetical protein B1813_08805 [Saccharomonospora piscinae]|uniref:Uncharacterized protein n=1 Tax=Saccharomonospora piscinae TaxID=687388 RepID=A0A1V9A5A1_SACPI|nr:hypothetical protein [Saccharomonospora piscinae]OQO92309.1 hypothetical protein B1813_08805 [Saccharomonospora piscinae]TLW91982.1 hypothetical protein FFT09_13860 [Saccharomonospora piscinae]
MPQPRPVAVDPPDDLAHWGLHCFCLGARSTPHRVVRMDDNGRVLYYARTGTTRAELCEHGIRPTDSALALLRAYGLVTVDGDRISTAFPILGPEAMGTLRGRTAELAESLVPRILTDLDAITAALSLRGWARCAYGVVFGYVVDGLLWDRLRQAGALPSTELSVERPFWNGAFWAMHPPRTGVAGTNEVAQPGAAMTMVWTDATLRNLTSLGRSPALPAALHAVARGDTPVGQLVTEDGHEWHLVDEDGAPTVPIIHRSASDPVHSNGLRIAQTIGDAVVGRSSDIAPRLVVEHGPGVALLVVAHELIWDVMAALVEAGALRRPEVMDDPRATPDALTAQLLVHVDRD